MQKKVNLLIGIKCIYSHYNYSPKHIPKAPPSIMDSASQNIADKIKRKNPTKQIFTGIFSVLN